MADGLGGAVDQPTAPAAKGAPQIDTNAILQGLLQQQATQEFQVVTSGDRTAAPKAPYGTIPSHMYGSANMDRPTLPYEEAMGYSFVDIQDERLKQMVVDAAGGDIKKYDLAWKSAVGQAAYMQAAGNNDVTVESLLAKWAKSGLPSQSTGSGGYGGPFKNVTRTVQLTDPGTANQVLNRALTSFLGRQSTVEEQRAFLKALNVQEKANPTVTTAVGNTTRAGTTQSQTQTGGFNREDFSERFAKSQEGYAEYQTATTYLDAFTKALENPTRAI